MYLLLTIFRNKHFHSPGLGRIWLDKEKGYGTNMLFSHHILQQGIGVQQLSINIFCLKICLNTRWIALQNFSYILIFF